jgi:hypothetical protein
MIADMEFMTLTLSLMTIVRRAKYSSLHGEPFPMPRSVFFCVVQS